MATFASSALKDATGRLKSLLACVDPRSAVTTRVRVPTRAPIRVTGFRGLGFDALRVWA